MNRIQEPLFIPIAPDSNALTPGVIFLANESRFFSSTFSEPLTTVATMWADPEGLKGILDFVAPQVSAARRFEFAKVDNAQAVPAEVDDARAIGSDFKRVDLRTPHEYGETKNRGLTIRIDRQASPGTESIEEMYVQFLMARLYRNDFARAIALLAANATNSSKTWAASGGCDPDCDVMDILIAAETASGLAANRILYGQAAYRLRAKALRGQDHAGIASTAGTSPDDLAPILGVDAVRVSGHRFQGNPAAKDRIVPSIVFAFFGQDKATLDDASNLKRFVSPMDDGTFFRVHRHEVNSQFLDLTVEQYSDVVLTGAEGIQKITVS